VPARPVREQHRRAREALARRPPRQTPARGRADDRERAARPAELTRVGVERSVPWGERHGFRRRADAPRLEREVTVRDERPRALEPGEP
ncbi:MAG: hypothetical protein ACK56I_19710, partial [bacterium]